MGYRSDVHILFYADPREREVFPTIRLWFDEVYPDKPDGGPWLTVDKGDDYIYVKYNDVKWYDSYADVQAVHKALEEFADTFPDTGCYEFVRIGESQTDIERTDFGETDARLNITREVTLD